MNLTCYPKEGRKGVHVICLDGEPWREVHSTIFGRRPHFPKQIASITEFESEFHQWEKKAAKAYALRRLAERSYHSAALSKCLSDRFVSEDNIQEVIAECQHLGYLNDQEWVQSFVRQQMRRHLGPRAILMKLRGKGITEEVAMSAIDQQDDPAARCERVRHLFRTKYRNRDLTDYKEMQKVIGALLRKGFNMDDILLVLNEERGE